VRADPGGPGPGVRRAASAPAADRTTFGCGRAR
jgi:hypothetical protein